MGHKNKLNNYCLSVWSSTVFQSFSFAEIAFHIRNPVSMVRHIRGRLMVSPHKLDLPIGK